MNDLVTLRPEVREAVREFDGKAYPGSRTHECWQTIRAELLRLQDEEIALSNIVQRQEKILTGVANALKGEPGRLHFHSHHDLAEMAKSTAKELAALKARIETAPLATFRRAMLGTPHAWVEEKFACPEWIGKRIRLVVEE